MALLPVWVTREEEPDGPLCTALRTRGLDVLLEPVLARRVTADPAALVVGLAATDWLVLTSPFAIEAFRDGSAAPSATAIPAARVPQVAVVGEASRRLAESLGLRVALVAADGHGETLFAQLRERVTSGVVCHPRSALAAVPSEWATPLTTREPIEFRAPVLYETTPREFDRTVAQRCALAAVASPSAVAALAGIDVLLASIGRTTTAAIRRQGRAPVVEAATPSMEALAEAIRAYLTRTPHASGGSARAGPP